MRGAGGGAQEAEGVAKRMAKELIKKRSERSVFRIKKKNGSTDITTTEALTERTGTRVHGHTNSRHVEERIHCVRTGMGCFP